MARHFLSIYPLLGKAATPLPLRYQQRSVYYWWWAYLRRNEAYIKCCARGGKGALSALYKDFGDVRPDDFRSWWLQRGADLFAEAPLPQAMSKLTAKDDWQALLAAEGVMVIAVPMTVARRRLKRMFADLLKREHEGRPGRRSLRNAPSSARYPLHGNFTVHSLKQMLKTYDAWLANQSLPAGGRATLWELGELLKLVQSAITAKSDTKYVRTNKRNVMTAAVGRDLRRARLLIANTAKGKFPCFEP